MGSSSECFPDQCACLFQLGSSPIVIGTQFGKAFLDPSLVLCVGFRNLVIQFADFGSSFLLQFLQLRCAWLDSSSSFALTSLIRFCSFAFASAPD